MNHRDIWGAIDSFAVEHRLSSSGLARAGGLDPTAFNHSKRWTKHGQEHWPSMRSIAKILAVMGEDFRDFAEYLSPSKKPQE